MNTNNSKKVTTEYEFNDKTIKTRLTIIEENKNVDVRINIGMNSYGSWSWLELPLTNLSDSILRLENLQGELVQVLNILRKFNYEPGTDQ